MSGAYYQTASSPFIWPFNLSARKPAPVNISLFFKYSLFKAHQFTITFVFKSLPRRGVGSFVNARTRDICLGFLSAAISSANFFISIFIVESPIRIYDCKHPIPFIYNSMHTVI